jgi:haloacetate dehalogenase
VPDFHYRDVQVGESTYLVGVAGEGPAVLLLHGFPENQYCWRGVAPALSASHSVVPLGEGYSKREMAAELVQVMDALGFERFSVVGHDRGGRVAYRMALEAPDRVERLCILNIIPTVDQFERMAEEASPGYYPWFLLAQPAPFPERLIGASAEYFLRHTLDDWTATPGAIDDDAVGRYLATFTPETIAAMCCDYRAAFHLDRVHDADDRAAGRRIGCAVLVHWGSEDMPDSPLPVWRRWADEVHGAPLPSGHFLPEEAPEELIGSLRDFLVSAS